MINPLQLLRAPAFGGGVQPSQAGVVPMQSSIIPAQTNGTMDITAIMNMLIMVMIVVMMMKMMTQATEKI